MAIFDSIVNSAAGRFGFGERTYEIAASALAIVADEENGGFEGLVDRLAEAGLADTAVSWITAGSSAGVSDAAVRSVFGTDRIEEISIKTGIGSEEIISAIGFMLPGMVDSLTPNGRMPDDQAVRSALSGLSDPGRPNPGITAGILDHSSRTRDDAGSAFPRKISLSGWLIPVLFVGLFLLLAYLFLGNSN